MGSTGRASLRVVRIKKLNLDTKGIKESTQYRGRIPEDSGLEPVSNNRITLKTADTNNNAILFQFHLSKDNATMSVIGYRKGIPEIKAAVKVDAQRPSLDKVITSGSSAEQRQATKLKDLFAKSLEVKENHLTHISQELLARKLNRRR